MISLINKKVRRLIEFLTGFKKSLAQAHLEVKFSAQDISKKTKITMEEYSSLGRIEAAPVSVKIGAYSFFRSGVISANLTIGRFCSIGENVHIGVNAQAHPTNWISTSPFQYDKAFKNTPVRLSYTVHKKETSIGNDVWIGEGVLIMEGVKIGDGAIIAARAVVIKDVAPYSIVGGIPAKFIKERFQEPIVQELLDKKWWEYSLDDMAGFSFDKPEDFIVQFNAKHIKKCSYISYMIVRHRNKLKIK